MSTAMLMMRHTISRAHNLPPYTLVTGRGPILPSHLPDQLPIDPVEPSKEEEESYLAWLLHRVQQLEQLAGHRMDQRERRLKQLMAGRKTISPVTLFHYHPT